LLLFFKHISEDNQSPQSTDAAALRELHKKTVEGLKGKLHDAFRNEMVELVCKGDENHVPTFFENEKIHELTINIMRFQLSFYNIYACIFLVFA